MTTLNRTQAALKMLDIARSEQRVHIINALGDVTLPIDCRDLAEQVDARSEMTADPPMDFKQALHHCHLPKLDEVGILTYDNHDRLVTEFDTERLSRLIDATAELLGEFPSK